MKTGRRRILTEKPEAISGNRFPATTVAKKVVFPGNARVRGKIVEGEIPEVTEADRWWRWPNHWQLYRKC